MSPEQDRSSLERRIAELTARMKALDHLRKPENVAEWAALYEARDELEKSLGERGSSPSSLE